MAKDKDTYLKVADYFKKVADRNWAQAKGNSGGYHYDVAKDFYERAKKALETANKMK